jgi:hypothetical protein
MGNYLHPTYRGRHLTIGDNKDGEFLVKSYMANAVACRPTSSQVDLFPTQSHKPGTSQQAQQSLSILDQGFLENPFEEMEFTNVEETSRTSDAETSLEKVISCTLTNIYVSINV